MNYIFGLFCILISPFILTAYVLIFLAILLIKYALTIQTKSKDNINDSK